MRFFFFLPLLILVYKTWSRPKHIGILFLLGFLIWALACTQHWIWARGSDSSPTISCSVASATTALFEQQSWRAVQESKWEAAEVEEAKAEGLALREGISGRVERMFGSVPSPILPLKIPTTAMEANMVGSLLPLRTPPSTSTTRSIISLCLPPSLYRFIAFFSSLFMYTLTWVCMVYSIGFWACCSLRYFSFSWVYKFVSWSVLCSWYVCNAGTRDCVPRRVGCVHGCS